MLGGSGAYDNASSLRKLKKKLCSLVRPGIYFDQIVS